MTEITKLVERVVELLDNGWIVEPAEPYAQYHCLYRPSGERFSLRLGSYGNETGRIIVSGRYPSHNGWSPANDPRNEAPRITVGAAREPEAIVREIERRFLPAYLDLFEQCRRWVEGASAKAARRLRNMQAIAKILDTEVSGTDQEPIVHAHMTNGAWGKFEPHGEDKVEMRLRGIPIATAVEIAKMLQLSTEMGKMFGLCGR